MNKINLSLDKEEQLYKDGIRAGISIAFEALRKSMPEILENVEIQLDFMLKPEDEVMN